MDDAEETMSKKEALIKATQKLMWKHGYESTSPRDILKESKAGQGSMYHHFEGKRDLALHALERNENELWQHTLSFLDDPNEPSALARLEAWMTAPRDVMLGCRLGRLSNEHSVREDDDLRVPIERYFMRAHSKVTEVVRQAREQGGGTSEHPSDDAIASMLISIIQGGYVLSMGTYDPRHMDRAAASAIQLVRTWARES